MKLLPSSASLPHIEDENLRVIYLQTAFLTGLEVKTVYYFLNHFHDSYRSNMQDMILARASLLKSHRIVKNTGTLIRR